MSRIIHINEDRYNDIKPLPFLDFYNDPIGTKPSETLERYGLTNGELRKLLLDYDIITKKENITEPFDERDGKMVSKYSVSYKVPKENFKNKIRNLHKAIFPIDEIRLVHIKTK